MVRQSRVRDNEKLTIKPQCQAERIGARNLENSFGALVMAVRASIQVISVHV